MNRDKLIKVIVSQRIIRNSFRKNLLKYLKQQKITLKANELLTLYYILAFKDLTQKEMSLYLDYDLATAGRILDALAKKDLISRTRSKTDGRRNDLVLTKKGEDLINGIHDQAVRWFNEEIKPYINKNSETKKSLADQTIYITKELTKNWGGTNEW